MSYFVVFLPQGLSSLAVQSDLTFAWQKNAEVARAYLEKASKRVKKWADMKRRPDPFNVGDMVLIKTDQLRRFNRTHRAHKGLLRRYEGPVPIVARLGKVSLKVQLPRWLRHTHPVFHASNLKLYHADMGDPARNTSTRPMPRVTVMPEREAEEVLADRQVSSTPDNKPHMHMEYLMK